MPSTRKKSPLTTSKKKKPSTSKAKNKKSLGNKNVQEQDVTVNNTDRSYLNDVSQATSKGDELLEIQSPNAGPAAILSTLMCLEELNRQIMAWMDSIEGNSAVSSTPIPSVVASGRDNVTFRLPKPGPT